MDERARRNGQRVEYALLNIRRQTEHGLMASSDEARRSALGNIKRWLETALFPPTDDEVLALWRDGLLSEGEAHQALGVTRLEARVMLREWEARRCAEGHEWREVTPYRETCVRCGKERTWEAE